MKYWNIANPRYANPEKTAMDCEVVFGAPVPFSANRDDTEEHGRAIFAACVAGEHGEVAEFIPPPEAAPAEQISATEKLRRFLQENPDVAASINGIAG